MSFLSTDCASPRTKDAEGKSLEAIIQLQANLNSTTEIIVSMEQDIQVLKRYQVEQKNQSLMQTDMEKLAAKLEQLEAAQAAQLESSRQLRASQGGDDTTSNSLRRSQVVAPSEDFLAARLSREFAALHGFVSSEIDAMRKQMMEDLLERLPKSLDLAKQEGFQILLERLKELTSRKVSDAPERKDSKIELSEIFVEPKPQQVADTKIEGYSAAPPLSHAEAADLSVNRLTSKLALPNDDELMKTMQYNGQGPEKLAVFQKIIAELQQNHKHEISVLQQSALALGSSKSEISPLLEDKKRVGFEQPPQQQRIRRASSFDSANLDGLVKSDAGSNNEGTMDEDFMPQMNWNFEDPPEDPNFVDRLSHSISGTCLGWLCGFSPGCSQVWIRWWHEKSQLPVGDEASCLRRLVDSNRFQTFCLLVIFINAAVITASTDADIRSCVADRTTYNGSDTDWQLLASLIFTSFYTVELCLKIFVDGWYFFLGDDRKWNMFDFALVLVSFVDLLIVMVWSDGDSAPINLTFLRIARILKITRIMRMMRAVKWVQELRLMLDCVLNSMLHLFWCLTLIVLVVTMFALLIVQGITGHLAKVPQDQYELDRDLVIGVFDSVPNAMLSLFMSTTGGVDWEEPYFILSRAGPHFEAIFLFYISFFCIVAWNIVMSMFVEKAFKLAIPDIETKMYERRTLDLHYYHELNELLRRLVDLDHDGTISISEFQKHIRDERLKSFFKARDFDIWDAELFFKMLASVQQANHPGEEPCVRISTFVQGCMRLRGNASNIDVQALHYELRNMHIIQRQKMRELKDMIVGVLGEAAVEGLETSPLNCYDAQQIASELDI